MGTADQPHLDRSHCVYLDRVRLVSLGRVVIRRILDRIERRLNLPLASNMTPEPVREVLAMRQLRKFFGNDPAVGALCDTPTTLGTAFAKNSEAALRRGLRHHA